MNQIYPLKKIIGVFFTAMIVSTGFAQPTLECLKEKVNSRFQEVVNLVPGAFIFGYDGDSTYISDGGNDMYDDGNYLSTDLGPLGYTNDQVVSTGSFGFAGSYVTQQHPGLFFMAANNYYANNFYITGGNGADGSGNADSYDFSVTVFSVTYNVYVKRVYNAGDPSINHMVIIPQDGWVYHNPSFNTDDDYDEIGNIYWVPRIYYLLFSSDNGGFIDNPSMDLIATKILQIINTPGELYTATLPTSSKICAGQVVSLEYDYCERAYSGANTMKLYLSDNTGSFAASTLLGSFTGSGTGTFNAIIPANTPPGNYKLRMLSTFPADTTRPTNFFRVMAIPDVAGTMLCPGDSVLLVENNGDPMVWLDAATGGNVLSTTSVYQTPPLSATTTYYVQIPGHQLGWVDSLENTSFATFEHNPYSGDDRGGVMVTDSFFYVNGDNNAVRVNAGDLSNPVSLPLRDGMWSDLRTGEKFSILDVSGAEIYTIGAPFTTSFFIGMDNDLNYTTDTIHLTTPITVNNGGSNGVFSGPGFMILYESSTQSWYTVETATGNVALNSIGDPQMYGSENWASWGYAEINGNDTLAVYRHNSGSLIVKYSLTTDAVVDTLGVFSDLSDMASITFSPWESRLYFHHESSSEFTNSGEEVGGYIEAYFTGPIIVNPAACMVPVDATVYTVNQVDLGPDQVVCSNHLPYTIDAGAGYSGYAWSTSEFSSSIDVNAAGTYFVTTIENSGCSTSDTIVIALDPCLSIEEENSASVNVYPNPVNDVLTISVNGFNEAVDVSIYDVAGRLVYTRAAATTQMFSVPVDQFENGVYSVIVKNNAAYLQKTFIKN